MVSGRIAAKVIQAATSAFLAREDTNHLVGSSQGFKHVSTIRLLSREDILSAVVSRLEDDHRNLTLFHVSDWHHLCHDRIESKCTGSATSA